MKALTCAGNRLMENHCVLFQKRAMKRTSTSRSNVDESRKKMKLDDSSASSPSPESSGDDFDENDIISIDDDGDELLDAVKEEEESPMEIDEDEEEIMVKKRAKPTTKRTRASSVIKREPINSIGDIEDLDPSTAMPRSSSGQVKIHHDRSRHKFTPEEIIDLRESLLTWYDKVQRVMPWRKPSPKFLESLGEEGKALAKEWEEKTVDHGYAVLVSEIMLQQTQVATVINYFNKWVKEFPSFAALAAAPLERVNEMWAGLGYYRRAKFLRECAIAVVEKHNGVLPKTAARLAELPGVGQYTAGAVASIVFGEVTPLVDGNVVRVLTRLRAIGADSKAPSTTKLLWDLARDIVDPDRPGDFNQSLMELGATVCTPKDPQCGKCPVRSLCLAHKEVTEMKSDQSLTPAEIAKPCDICTSTEKTMSVTKYPVVPKKKAPRDLSTLLSIVERKNDSGELEYLFVQRPKSGLLASFWEFPSKDLGEDESVGNLKSRQEAMNEYLASIGISFEEKSVQTRKYLGEVTHVFSHIKQILHVEYISLEAVTQTPVDRKLQWVTPEGMESMAMSKGMKKCFDLLKKEKKGAKPKSSIREKKTKVEREPPKMGKIDSFFKPKK